MSIWRMREEKILYDQRFNDGAADLVVSVYSHFVAGFYVVLRYAAAWPVAATFGDVTIILSILCQK